MKKVLIFCASGYGRRVLYALDTKNYEVVGFVDGNSSRWGGTYAGKPIWNPELLKGSELSFDYIIISYPEFESEIRAYLMQLGVEDDRIITYERFQREVCWSEERVISLRACIEQIKERGIEGDMVELGVYQGAFSSLMNQYLPDRKLYLFDTFRGFDADRDHVDVIEAARFKDTSAEYVLSKMPYPEQCIIKEGYFPDTAVGVEDKFCLVSIDADLYAPVKAGLEYFYPRLVHGGYILVHDFNFWRYPGVKKAVYEYCEEKHIGFFPMSDKCESAVITK